MTPLFQLGGAISPPAGTGSVTTGLPAFITNFIRLAAIIGGVIVLLNFILAGYEFLTAAGDPKKVQEAWKKIWQSLVGLLIIVAAVAFVSIAGQVFFKGEIDILAPTIEGPGTL